MRQSIDMRIPKTIMGRLIDGLSSLPAHARQSITFDRGTEFSAWQDLKEGLGIDSWFCDPKSPWQKGTVENTNNRLCRYLPRKCDIRRLSDHDMKMICDASTIRPARPPLAPLRMNGLRI